MIERGIESTLITIDQRVKKVKGNQKPFLFFFKFPNLFFFKRR